MLAMLLTLTGCDLVGKTCNLMYAPDMLAVEATRSEGWEGELTVIAEGDGVTITCTILAGETVSTCDNDGSSAELSGDTLSIFLWEFAPDTAELIFSIDATEIAAESLAPAYDVDEPNGEGCGERRSATEIITL
ncbi:MAG: hypothetical protein ACI8S6_003848 [Myxococcota bacterium]|jgi:hypothetical protein